MHSITESEGVPSDPYEVLCHMAALIIEGRTPLQMPIGESSLSGECVAKPPKPYHEGPHCPNFMKLFNKESSSTHKCSENNVLCLRFNKLKQHLHHLFEKSVPISVEVSLGPDCLCGELRSQSTLVSVTPCKRDIVLEQWTINITTKRGHEPSQMSVMNLYQAVRSLLHFSQLTAWYMRNNGMKPANVIYRVGVPGDSAFVGSENFVKHEFPVADINKGVTMKMSVQSAPRMENIPSVYCPQHSCGHLDNAAQNLHQDMKDFTRLNKEKMSHSLSPKSGMDEKDELTDLLMKLQGARKKIYKPQEKKTRNRLSYFNASTAYDVTPDLCDCLEYLDAISVDKKLHKSKNLYESLTNAKTQPGNGNTSAASDAEKFDKDVPKRNLKKLNDFDPDDCSPLKGTKDGYEKCSDKNANIVDDRMQTSCAIFGKHHCRCEYEEEGENLGVEKPRRRRSVCKSRPGDSADGGVPGATESDWVTHGKFKDVEKPASKQSCLVLKNVKRSIQSETPKWVGSDLPVKKERKVQSSCHEECLPTKTVDRPCVDEGWRKDTTKDADGGVECKDQDDRECSASDDEWESSTNPFLAAILRTAKMCKSPSESEEQPPKACDNSHNLCSRGLDKKDEYIILSSSDRDHEDNKRVDNGLNSTKSPGKEKRDKRDDENAKVVVPQSENAKPKRDFAAAMETCQSTPTIRCKHRHISDLRLERRLSAVRDLSNLGTELCSADNCGPSEFITKSLTRIKSLFDKRDEESGNKTGSEICRTDFEAFDGSGAAGSNTKTIPVPSAQDKLKFRRSLDSAAQLVFHRCSGLPLTSSPAPVRRNNNSFTFDSSLNSVSAIKSALFDCANTISSEDENESEGSLKSPASPGAWSIGSKAINYHSLSPLPLLGTFEESVLNGRLEPVSTVHGFTAELGASGSFCPRHLYLPVTVFFYTLGDNDKVSAPYLGHINLGKKGYNVPRSGTIQVTLFNPLRTVVKMFVVVYDLHDMPPNSQTFLRQRTLYVPAAQKEPTCKKNAEDYHKYLRYLIHLRFISGKSGRIYLHTDIRMIIFRKADEDTATALGRQVDGEMYELRSHTHGPTNPKFSPRK